MLEINELELLDAELLGVEEKPADGTSSSWWKWALGTLAAVGLGYVLVRDLSLDDMVPRPILTGSRPW